MLTGAACGTVGIVLGVLITGLGVLTTDLVVTGGGKVDVGFQIRGSRFKLQALKAQLNELRLTIVFLGRIRCVDGRSLRDCWSRLGSTIVRRNSFNCAFSV